MAAGQGGDVPGLGEDLGTAVGERADLDIAGQLAQTLGFSGSSCADIASRLGLARASLRACFEANEGWLSRVLREGSAAGQLLARLQPTP